MSGLFILSANTGGQKHPIIADNSYQNVAVM